MKRLSVPVLVLSLVGLLFGAVATAEEGSGKIDWEKKVIVATGKGAPDLNAQNVAVARIGAEKAAKLDALRNILATLKGVKVTGSTTIGSQMESNQQVRSEIEGIVKNFEVVETRYYSDGGVEVDVRMSLDGQVGAAVLDGQLKASVPSTGVTGLIVDASGLKVVPVLAPRILDEKRAPVYDVSRVTAAGAMENGIVNYTSSLDKAKGDQKVSGNPLVVRAVAVENGTDIVISAADAQKLADSLAGGNFLEEGRVIIVN